MAQDLTRTAAHRHVASGSYTAPMTSDSPEQPEPSSPAGLRFLVAGAAHALCLDELGELVELETPEAEKLISNGSTVVCHGPFTAKRLGLKHVQRSGTHLDILELFAFIRPAQFCLPTVRGLARALELPLPLTLEDEAMCLHDSMLHLLNELKSPNYLYSGHVRSLAMAMARGQWGWSPYVLAALPTDQSEPSAALGFDVWSKLGEWEEIAPSGEPDIVGIDADETRRRLESLLELKSTAGSSEVRPAQSDYAAEISKAFQPRRQAGQPNIVLAEAGTGIGKTLGYIAPASLWSELNGPGTWVSTYTKNLQRQVDDELTGLYGDPDRKSRKVVVRKGRENYLCLLNYQENLARRNPVIMGLIARWILYSRNGDLIGGDFPAWITALTVQSGAGQTTTSLNGLGLTDRRGECIYSACQHYRKCFIEKATRRSRRADIVIANHALVMYQTAAETFFQKIKRRASAQEDEEQSSGQFNLPINYVFDEGHHLFDAADGAFSSHLSGLETSELRRWIRGPEDQRSRGRGLRSRLDDFLDGNNEIENALNAALKAAGALCGGGWTTRISEGRPDGPTEAFLHEIHAYVLARSPGRGDGFSQEAAPWPVTDDVLAAAKGLETALKDLASPLTNIARLLREKLDDESKKLESSTRSRIDALAKSLERRALMTIPAWISMLTSLKVGEQDGFVDWFGLDRAYGRLFDVGMHRHWIDPTIPFAEAVLENAHGVVITSATLRDHPNGSAENADRPDDWVNAEMRTGASHLTLPAIRRSFQSPFNYQDQTRVIVVNDVARDDPNAVAAAYRELFIASGGGGLGLFTAISRLRNVYEKLATYLDDCGIPLYAQHVDAMDTGTLVDIFRSEVDACLLGTDAVRDGVDVPGKSLRLIVFDRVPWPRPDILHKARREHFGGRHYDDMICRLKLKQAYGRLVRRSNDRGVFVMLDSRTPSRLLSALPEDVEILRLGLADAIATVDAFLGPQAE